MDTNVRLIKLDNHACYTKQIKTLICLFNIYIYIYEKENQLDYTPKSN